MTPVVSHEQEYGDVVSVQRSVQVPAPAGERWIVTFATPDPPSVPVAPTVTVRCRGVPGSVAAAVGAVLSTRRFVTTVELVVLATLSVATARRS